MTDWLDQLPFDPGPPHVRMGTRQVGERDWLLADEHRAAALALKTRLLADRRPAVVAVTDSSRPTLRAQAETRSLVDDWQRRHGPIGEPPTATPAAPRIDPPPAHHAPELEAAARRVQEDLCLMRIGDRAPMLVAAVVCFPSYWRLADKIGRPMAEIHRPVPDYAGTLGTRPDRLLEGLGDGRIVARRNWSIHDGGEMFAPVRPAPRPLDPDEVADRLWLRSERQTLRRLPAGDHVLFTIRVQQLPFAALRHHPTVGLRLAGAVRAEAPRRTDRLAAGHAAPVLRWLEALDPTRD